MARQLSHWRHGGAESTWPPLFERPVERWPPAAPHTFTPTREAGAVRVCLRPGDNGAGSTGSTFTRYVDRAAAVLDDAKRDGPCSPGCLGRHFLVWCEPGRVRVTLGAHDTPPQPTDLRRALWAAGYERPFGATTASTPARWPAPASLNPRLGPPARNGHRRREDQMSAKPPTPKEPAVTEPPTDEQAAAIIASERAAGRHLARIGVNRRAALAHREVADLRANGADPEAIEAAELVAKALTDAALADLDGDAQAQ
jgi:hypothetical protein